MNTVHFAVEILAIRESPKIRASDRSPLASMDVSIWSEHGESDGWVNVHCKTCSRTFETNLEIEKAK